MPVAWFVVPYKRHPLIPRARYPLIDDYTDGIRAHGGQWRETEILGDRALVKVRAPLMVLDALAADPGIKRIPKKRLDDALSDLPQQAIIALRDELLDQGYTMAQIRERFGDQVDLSEYTLGDVLRFMASRRRTPRYIEEQDVIVLDGQIVAPESVDLVDSQVPE